MNESRIDYGSFFQYIFTLSIIACLFLAYFPVFQKMLIRWDGGDNSYCYLIVPLVAYLLWDKRAKRERYADRGKRLEERSLGQSIEVGGRRLEAEGKGYAARGYRLEAEGDLPQTSDLKPNATEGFASDLRPNVGGFRFGEFSWSVWGLAPVALSVLLIIIGELGSVETFLYTGIWGCAVGMTVIFYGWRIRYLIFPLVILFFIVPLPPFVNRILTFNLKLAASTLSVAMLRACGASVLQQGNIIDIGMTQLQVVDACSGVRYLMPLILMAMLVGYFFVKRRWQWMILILLVPPLSVVVNAFRIFLTGVLIRSGHPKLAEDFFHDFSGWLVFMVAGAILIATALILRKIKVGIKEQGVGIKDHNELNHLNEPNDPNLSSEIHVNEERSAFHRDDLNDQNALNVPNEPNYSNQNSLKPLVLTIVLCFMFIGSGWAMKKIPSARNLPPRASFDSFPVQIAHWYGKKRTIEDKILKELWADDYLNAFFQNSKTANSIYLLIPFYEYQGTRHTAHAPQSCLLGGGWDMLKDQNHVVAVHPDKNIEIRTMHLKKGDFRMLGSYFFFQRGRVITSPWMNKLYLVWDSITRLRTDGALVRVEMTIAPDQSMESAYAMLDEFIKVLWPILPRYIPN